MSDTAPAAPAAASPTVAPTETPSAQHDFQRMSAEQFSARLKSERESARREYLKDLGVEKIEDVKARFAKAAELEAAQLSELEKWQKKAADYEPHVKRAASFEASIKKYLEAEEAAIPEAKRGLMELAPEQPEDRLAWIAKAKAAKLFAEIAPHAVVEPPREPKPATTLASVGPATAKPAGTVNLYEQYQELKARNPLLAANFRVRHEKAIDELRPKSA